MDRRQYLQRLGGAAGLVTITSTAGCGGDGDSGDTTDPGTTTADGPTTTDSDGTTTTDPVPTTQSSETTTDDSGTATVTVEGFNFAPVRLRVDPGTTVRWLNQGSAAHTVVSTTLTDDGESWSFDQRASGGGSVRYTFERPGVYEYVCDIHGQGSMCGVVLVGDAGLEATLPCE